MDINKIIKNYGIKIDNNINIEEILKKSVVINEHKTINEINEQNKYIISKVINKKENIDLIVSKLIGYYYINKIYEIQKGHYIRWYCKTEQKLKNGGIVINIIFTDKGCVIVCKNMIYNNIYNLSFDKYIFFQKLTNDELLIYYYLETINK